MADLAVSDFEINGADSEQDPDSDEEFETSLMGSDLA